MSWLFGKKKHQKDSPTDSTEEDPSSSDPIEDFVTIERPPSNPAETYPGATPYPIGSLYPQISGMGTYTPSPLPNLNNQNAIGDTTHYLSGVPFKLCKQLESNMNNDLVIDLLRVEEILSFIEQINNKDLDYDFSLEHSVISELSSRTSE